MQSALQVILLPLLSSISELCLQYILPGLLICSPCLRFLCCSVKLLRSLSFSDFAMRFARDKRFKAFEKMREREAIYNEFMDEERLRIRKKKDEEASSAERVSWVSIAFHSQCCKRWSCVV